LRRRVRHQGSIPHNQRPLFLTAITGISFWCFSCRSSPPPNLITLTAKMHNSL
jgi:hypothetical protein